MIISECVGYIVSIIIDIILIFLCAIHVVEFDEIRTSKKSPVEQCNFLNPLVLPEYCLQAVLVLIFLIISDWLCLVLSLPLLIYHCYRWDLLNMSYFQYFLFRYYLFLSNLSFSDILLIEHFLFRYSNRPILSQAGLYDPTAIFNNDLIERSKLEGWIKLIVYIVTFFFSVYGWVDMKLI